MEGEKEKRTRLSSFWAGCLFFHFVYLIVVVLIEAMVFS